MNFNKALGFIILIILCYNSFAQCCAGGSGSPIAGGASQGVLKERQVDINSNFQHVTTSKFLTGHSAASHTENYFKSFKSDYIYTRVGYGVTKNFTTYVEAGYFINKTEQGFVTERTYKSKGIGDLVIFPRYDLINKTINKKHTELTVGLGFKIPLGKYNDSARHIEPFSGDVYYVTKPMAVQPSSGAHDIIFYSFYLKDYKKYKLFANALYIKKGWNPEGEKVGNFLSLSLFASKTFFDYLGVTVQLKGEWVDKMKVNNSILLYDYPNYDPFATGSKKVFFVPQVSYTFFQRCTVFAASEIPIYQYVTKTQIASQYQATLGLSYRFMLKEKDSE